MKNNKPNNHEDDKYRFLFENMSQGIFYQRADGTLIDVNRAALDILGISRKQFLSRTSMSGKWKLIHEDDSVIPGDQHPSMVALKTGIPVRDFIAGVFNPVRKDYVWLIINAIPLFMPGNKKAYQVFVTFQDITERKINEKSLRINEELFRSVIENMLDVFYRTDKAGNIIMASPSATTMLGYSSVDEILGRPILSFWAYPRDRRQMMMLLKRQGHIKDYEVTLLRKDGALLQVSVSSKLMYDSRGNINGVEGIFRDISDRKRLENELRESEFKYRNLFETSPDSIFLVDRSTGNFLAVNSSACRLYGYSAEEFLHMNANDISAEPKKTKDAIHGGIVSVPLRFHRRKDGSLFPVEITGTYFTMNNLKIHTAFIRDVTVRTDAERSIQEYQKQLKALSLELGLKEDRERRKIASDLHDHISQSLFIAKLKLGELRSSLPEGNGMESLKEITRLIDNAIHTTRSLIYELSPPILYELGLEPALDWLIDEMSKSFGLKTRMRISRFPNTLGESENIVLFRAIRELLMNVVKHARVNEAVLFIDVDRKKCVTVRVSDTGAGFDVSKAFIMHKDYGFGMFNLKEQIESLGGTMLVESLPGQGATITLKIPPQANL